MGRESRGADPVGEPVAESQAEGQPGREDTGLWRVEQAADYLGIRPKTLYEWVRRGRVPHRKLGFNVRFDPGELRRWTREQARGGDADEDPERTGPAPDELRRLRELMSSAAESLGDLQREVGTHLSYPQRQELAGLVERLEEGADFLRSFED